MNLRENRGYWKLKEEARDLTLCRNSFVRSYGHVVRQTAELMATWILERCSCIYNIQGVTGGTDQTSGGCSLY